MKVIDLGDEHRELFACCLEDWSAEAREAGPRRTCWVERFLRHGLRGKLAVDDDGTIGGMIQYLPIEHSTVDGEGLYFIPCIWVHGHQQGRGNFQGRGMGRALLEAAEADARSLGAKGMAAWGLWLPFWMKASWYRKHGYRTASRKGISVLVWKPFTQDARPPRWFMARRNPPGNVRGKVTVTAFVNGWCMAGNLSIERARRAAAAFGDRVVFREIDVSEHAAIAEWGRSDELFIDRKAVRTGPPPTYEKLRGIIEKRVRRL
jgi:GNAT superfamily N-acetyltransferase